MQGADIFTGPNTHQPTRRTEVREAGAKAGIRTDGVQVEKSSALAVTFPNAFA